MITPLLCMLDGRPGTFLELGAFTGVNLSNTVMLERCYNWTGLLVEASDTNFAQLEKSGRQAKMIHSAVCPGHVDSTVEFAIDGGEVSGEPSTRLKPVGAKATKLARFFKTKASRVVKVPCRSLGRILDGAGYSTMDILFLVRAMGFELTLCKPLHQLYTPRILTDVRSDVRTHFAGR